jgi:hypothetical protein
MASHFEARSNKSAKIAVTLSGAARAALSNAMFDGRRWMLRYPAAETADELIALKLAQRSNREVYVTLSGMGIRTIVGRPGYPGGAVSW